MAQFDNTNFEDTIRLPNEAASFVVPFGASLFDLVTGTMPTMGISSLTEQEVLSLHPPQSTPFDYRSIPVPAFAKRLDESTLQSFWERGFRSFRVDDRGHEVFAPFWLGRWWYINAVGGRSKGKWASAWAWVLLHGMRESAAFQSLTLLTSSLTTISLVPSSIIFYA
ncbi:hypothetical protein CONPUDRAFT_160168 [Coniophora puteana RWD-64-598 SS2]|uniref:Uncharacterized protein n=1 Tax=Coniophora puteana (strain RWD-64-598) TaxID=741705 RepID=R7SF09_CONPW|nr:uncharacterized protein CONPUDRAFT_160168 [Coniophora puteana RWD-64-598 SS2]EIW74465.1 hypothetical protein CONPUDRAFT_160168 [Coniophora puteana RWD-64-598 SS2]